MGYYTQFELETDPKNWYDSLSAAEVAQLNEITEGYLADVARGDGYLKWYKWRENLAAISQMYPEVKFMLSGIGEDYTDFWRACAIGGKVLVSTGHIEYGPYE